MRYDIAPFQSPLYIFLTLSYNKHEKGRKKFTTNSHKQKSQTTAGPHAHAVVRASLGRSRSPNPCQDLPKTVTPYKTVDCSGVLLFAPGCYSRKKASSQSTSSSVRSPPHPLLLSATTAREARTRGRPVFGLFNFSLLLRNLSCMHVHIHIYYAHGRK